MDPYEQHIEELKKQWIGKKVLFGKKVREVVDVSFDGFIILSTPTLKNKRRKTFILPEYAQIVEEDKN